MSRPRPTTAARLRASLSALLLGLLATVALGSVPAQAHGGPISIGLGTDGGGGIDAYLTYTQDGHPVEESAAITVVAVSETGEEVGPLTLQSSTSGVGWYHSEAGVLGEGHWTVTGTLTSPSEAEASVELDVVALPAPTASEPAESESAAEGDAASDETSTDAVTADGDTEVEDASAAATPGDTSGGGSTGLIIGGVALVAVLAAVAVVLMRRRKATHR
ncbi:hypothetical protein [Serinibacter arcticus]|uniref:Uncharacterized protein n=1 Tax=Serinibacter arcticus TaxID=1655435 RepID=A0A4Z1E3V7_9MICO|nr:hypothetical protein [Serinibacter arcticus]TGO05153.1 hypothetical protein SERN_1157 [Serinibacter arcticus]